MYPDNSPIDAVITWVDGQDPDHMAKMARYRGDRGKRDQAKPHGLSVRFEQSDEIRYCVRSIRNYAPWIGTIHIITDGQVPDCFDLSHPDAATIRIVDHKEIFAGYEDLLPSFNSLSIETMMWRIPGLAERFIYFNDDFFLTNPARPEEYFDREKLVVRGVVKNHAKPGPGKMQYEVHRHAALMLGQDASHVIRTRHCPLAMRVSLFEEVSAMLGDRFFENARPRFRSTDQFSVSGLLNMYAHEKDLCTLVGTIDGMSIQWSNVPRNKAEAGAYLMEHFSRRDLKFMCINQLSVLKKHFEKTETLISAHCGPPLALERL